MALIQCPECGGKMSSTVDTCIHCGYKLTLQYKLEHGLVSENELMDSVRHAPYTQAIPVCEMLAKKNNLEACRILGWSYYHGDNGCPQNLSKAKEYFSKFKDTDEECAYGMALIYADEHKGKATILANYKKVLASRNFSSETKGDILNQMGLLAKGEEAIAYYKEAYSLGNFHAAVNLMDTYYENKLYMQGIEFGEEALKKRNLPNEHKSHIMNWLGLCLTGLRKSRERFARACGYFKKAYKLFPLYIAVANYIYTSIDRTKYEKANYYKDAILFGEEVLAEQGANIPQNLKASIENSLGEAFQCKINFEKTYRESDIRAARNYYNVSIADGHKVAQQNLYVFEKEMQQYRPQPSQSSELCCPFCGSTNIHKISLANKAASIGVFGLFAAGHVSKTYKCDNCGSKW